MIIESLEKNGFLYVPYPEDLRKGVEDAMEAWKAFCALPSEDKLRFGYDGDVKTSGNGYELKLDVSAGDLKEDAHMRLAVREDLLERAHRVDSMVAPAFVEKALAVNELMRSILEEFSAAVESSLGLSGFKDDVMEYQPRWLIRFLHYFGDRKPGDEIASPHVDKGGFTLHLYESHPGVEYLSYETREWTSLPLSHSDTVIIPGMGLQNRSKGKLRALCHRVVATEDTATTGRFSAVCFFNFKNVRFYDKSTFGRLQSQEPGAFYDMSFEKFDGFFID